MTPTAPPTERAHTAALPPIDPRIRARRIEVRKTAGRRKLQRLVDVGVVVVVAALFVGALWTPLLDVDVVEVRGAEHTGTEVVRDRAGVARGDRLVGVDVRVVGERVAALPWVGEAAVHRRVDGTVTIEVTERVPVALVGTGESAVLVDRQGRVLGPAVGVVAANGLPTLTSLQGVPAAGAFLDAAADEALVVAERLIASVPGAVATVDVAELSALLHQGGVVRFGDATRLDAKLRSLRTVLDQVDLRCLATIDLRLPGSPVLTREERCS